MIKRVKGYNRTATAQYCVTKITKIKDKIIQTQVWCNNLKEAKEIENGI